MLINVHMIPVLVRLTLKQWRCVIYMPMPHNCQLESLRVKIDTVVDLDLQIIHTTCKSKEQALELKKFNIKTKI